MGDKAAGAGARKIESREQILQAAIELIDSRGVRELTMRTLGARLGVEAMALYYYVPSKDDLLDGVVELVIDELYGDPDVHLQGSSGWQDFLVRLAHGVRRMALAHPEVFPLVATRPPAAPWVRPPLRSLRWVENFLDNLLEAGFTEPAAVAAYRAFTSFLLGHLLLEVSSMGVDTGPVDEAHPAESNKTDLTAYPRLAQLAPELTEDHAAVEFEESLESLIDRLRTTLAT